MPEVILTSNRSSEFVLRDDPGYDPANLLRLNQNIRSARTGPSRE